MKKHILALALGTLTLTTGAAPRSASQALDLARRFAVGLPVFRQANSPQLSLSNFNSASMKRVKGQASLHPDYYIVNVGESNGFVVVAGDDRFKPVLGYVTEGHLAEGDLLPDGLQYWLDFLAGEMRASLAGLSQGETIPCGEESISVLAETVSAQSENMDRQYVQSVSPLLTTKWNQTAPYNNKIPNYATGCVATGTAQVMKYWNYPQTGRGSHTNAYFSTYSADFGSTVYDWNNMKDVYGGKYDTKAEVDAVSTLMYHLGVATDMRWTKDNSGTPNMYAGYALINFFGYNRNLYAEGRDYMSLGAWKALILQQLYSGHPLCYAGMTSSTSGVGHFFVLDGYDADTGTFHFNWGWGGAYDGYFALTALSPGGEGQAGALSGSYNYYQQIFVNVQPEETDEYVAHFNADAVTPAASSCLKNSVVMQALHLSNDALGFVGTIGMAVYKTDGTLFSYVASPQTFPGNLNIGSSYSDAHDVPVDLKEIPDGTYTVCVAVQHRDHLDNPYPVRAFYGRPTYYTMTVEGDNANFAAQSDDVQLTDMAQPVILDDREPNTLYHNIVSEFLVTLKNTGTCTFNDEVGVCIQKGSRDGSRQFITVPCTLLPGEEKTVHVSGKVLREPGAYKLIPCYVENGSYIVLGQSLEIAIDEEITGIHEATESAAGPDRIVNLQGMRLNPGSTLKRGLYIVNGKKRLISR